MGQSESGDNRSYRVAFDKIHEALEGFRVRWTAERGAEQLRAVFSQIDMDQAVFEQPPFYTAEAAKTPNRNRTAR